VFVNTDKAPYAMWVELGKFAGEELPYAKVGTTDYSKSRFVGHRYLERALEEYKSSNKASLIVANAIREQTIKLRNM